MVKLRSKKPKITDGSMSLMEHLRELRSRLLKASIFIIIAVIAAFFVSKQALDFLLEPYCGRFGENQCLLAAQTPAEPFLLRLRLSMYLGLIASAPFWLYQLWAFIAPGLHRHEKRWAYGFAFVATPLFATGAFLAHYIAAKALEFFLGESGQGDNNISITVGLNGYFDFVTGLMMLFGAAFEFPIVVFMLNLAGVASAQKLLGWWRTAVFLIFLAAAIVTPTPDPFTMTALALPLCFLYFVAVGAAALNDRRRARKRKESGYDLDDDEASPLEEPSDLDAEYSYAPEYSPKLEEPSDLAPELSPGNDYRSLPNAEDPDEDSGTRGKPGPYDR